LLRVFVGISRDAVTLVVVVVVVTSFCSMAQFQVV
jgi:hypothetical protein